MSIPMVKPTPLVQRRRRLFLFGLNLALTLRRIHPYRYEINNIQYPSRMFTSVEPYLPNSFENTPFTWVDTPTAFAAMLEKLRVAQEIAIDLEHHSYRTFAGFVCLMQISTRESDWVVDTLALREELEELNEVFTDPNIVKVSIVYSIFRCLL